MRLRAILGEAWRNLATGTTRALLFAVLLAVTGTTLAFADVLAISDLRVRAEQFRDTGASIRTLMTEGNIDPASCDAIVAHGPINAAGAIGATDPVTITVIPGNPIPAFAVTPGLASVLNLTSTAPTGAWVSEQLAATLNAQPGTVLPTNRGDLTIGGTFPWPDDGRDSRLGYALLIPSSTAARLDECWAIVWPSSPEADSTLRTAAAVQPGSRDALTLSQVNKNYGVAFDGSGEYGARLTQRAWIIAGAVAVLLGYAATRTRRLQHAASLHAGARKTTVLATALIETFVWALGGIIITVAALALLCVQDPASFTPVFRTSAKYVALALPASLIGAMAATLGIKERHLFRFFKDR
jgi:hypothetical protein